MRSGLANSGTRMIAVRIAAWAATEMIRALRRMRRSRARCSGVPSTKQPCREPNSFCGLGPGSIDITHLHRKVLRVRTEIFATPASCGLLNYRRRPAPRSQGCEVRASSVIFDTVKRDKFPNDWDRCDPFCKELPSIQLMEWICLDAGRRNLGVIESRFVAGAVTGPKRVPKRGVRNAPSLKLSGMCRFVLPAMASEKLVKT